MLDDQPVLETENIETDLWPEEIVDRVGEDEVSVFESADDSGFETAWRCVLNHRSEAL